MEDPGDQGEEAEAWIAAAVSGIETAIWGLVKEVVQKGGHRQQGEKIKDAGGVDAFVFSA